MKTKNFLMLMIVLWGTQIAWADQDAVKSGEATDFKNDKEFFLVDDEKFHLVTENDFRSYQIIPAPDRKESGKWQNMVELINLTKEPVPMTETQVFGTDIERAYNRALEKASIETLRSYISALNERLKQNCPEVKKPVPAVASKFILKAHAEVLRTMCLFK